MGFVRFVSAASVLAAAIGTAHAGGFSRGVADTEILYEDGNFNMRAGAIIVIPTQKIKTDVGGATNTAVVGTDYLETYAIPSGAVKLSFGEHLACAGTYVDAYGAKSGYIAPFGPSSKVSEDFTVTEFGATCAAFMPIGPGRLAVLGGAFVEKFDYALAAAPLVRAGVRMPLGVELDSSAYGWRAGIGYDIPDIAFRAQLLYRSGTKHEAEGAATFGGRPIGPAFGRGELPQSVELRMQSGIAPGWLAFGSVKWTDWSVNQTLDLVTALAASKNQYYWRDGWTVTGGVGHSFNEKISGLVSLQWDRGVATGYDFRSDKWLLAAGLAVKDDLGGELRLGAALSYLTSASAYAADSNERGASVDSGWAGILSANYSVKW
ncbi:aromatic hydrocarbon degradation protein [Nitratireductor aquimarinus]|uniref:outer membrane protein transport protein n=1 Tax=Nitratireductor TaxID=245876 RepID=UPI000DE07A86|nr:MULTISPECIES: outer membrane protein transport protein [Nitratireductor]MBN8244455.1 aromatic hydrocarbon degradation protein [Nitratireductor aquimarinus]MBY6132843.1 aromatic hydrocarbon degradation protein [Nitratireductor aquimarinus]MCA1301687.1 aromatic hydrocarbon degradation protein [Nitratireductor aquimarinus]